MIKFIHKKHLQENKVSGKIVIYYNISDIFLGVTLLILVAFFINDYLSHTLATYSDSASLYQDFENLPELE